MVEGAVDLFETEREQLIICHYIVRKSVKSIYLLCCSVNTYQQKLRVEHTGCLTVYGLYQFVNRIVCVVDSKQLKTICSAIQALRISSKRV